MSNTTRWVVDPAHSSAEFRVPHFWGLVKVKGHFDRIGGWLEVDDDLRVQGELLAAGERVALDLRPIMWQVDDRIEVDASTAVDQRRLGMTWSPLGIARTPTVVTVHARLRPQ